MFTSSLHASLGVTSSSASIMNSSSLPNCLILPPNMSLHGIRNQFESYLVEAVAYGLWLRLSSIAYLWILLAYSYFVQIGFLALLYCLLCNQIYRHAKIERTRGTWLLFAHSTAIFIITSIEVGCDLRVFEIAFVTCWKDPTRVVLAREICFGLLTCLQDVLLVSSSMQCIQILC